MNYRQNQAIFSVNVGRLRYGTADTLSNVGRQPAFEMSVMKAEVEINVEFPTLADVGPCRPMSANVGSDKGRSGMAENVGAAVEIASPSFCFQKLFPFPVRFVAILIYRRRTKSSAVG